MNNESTEQLLSPPTISTQYIVSIPPINYDTHPLFEQPQVPSFCLGPYRPEPLYAIHEHEGYSSLPPEKTSMNTDFMDSMPNKAHYWEAEDAEEFITTLNEFGMINDSSSNLGSNAPSLITVAADVHYSNQSSRPMSLNLSQINLPSGNQIEVYSNAMMESCYGDINNPFNVNRSDDEISLINKSTDNLLDGLNSAKMSGFNSMTSSIMTTSTGNSFLEGDERSLDIAQVAQNGESFKVFS